MNNTPAPSKSLDLIINHIRDGGIAFVATQARITTIDSKTLAKFEKVGAWLLKEEGDGYRLRMGKGSVYLFAGQLRLSLENELKPIGSVIQVCPKCGKVDVYKDDGHSCANYLHRQEQAYES